MVIKSETKQKVIADREIGKPIKEIMSEHGISKASVHKILNVRTKELNLPQNTFMQSEDKPEPNPGDVNKVMEMLGATDLMPDLPGMKKATRSKAKDKDVNELLNIINKPTENTQSTWSNILSTQQSPEEEKAGLIQKLSLNIKYYGDTLLKDLISDQDAFKASLVKKSTNELKNLLALFESTRNIESTSMYIRNTYFMGTKLLEGASGFVKLNLAGLTDRLRAEQDLEMIFKEIAITHASKFSKATSPEMRLLMVTLSTVVQIDMMNRIMSIQNKAPRIQPVKSVDKTERTEQPEQPEQTAEQPQPDQSEQKEMEELLKKFSDI